VAEHPNFVRNFLFNLFPTDQPYSNCQVGFDLNTGGLTLDTQVSRSGLPTAIQDLTHLFVRVRAAFLSSTLRSQIPGSESGYLVFVSSCTQLMSDPQMSTTQPNSLAGSVVLDNVAFSGISKANIQDSSGTILAASAATVPHWFQGNLYLG
jgi:hypothetical protein